MAPKPLGRFAARRAILAVEPQAEDDAVAAGRSAELALRGLMQDSHALKTARIYHSKRVPKVMGRADGTLPGGGGRYEIDLIVVTPRQMTVIEIKNWSGALRVENGNWVQARRGGDEIDHGPVEALNRKKLDVLTAYLSAKSVRSPPLLAARVMLWNTNLQLPEELLADPAVIPRGKIDSYLAAHKQPGFGARLMNAVMSLVLEGEARDIGAKRVRPLGRWKMRKLHRALDALNGFDHVELVGGKVLAGDLLILQGRHGTKQLRGLMKNGTVVEVHCKRGVVASLVTALLWGRLVRLGKPMRGYQVSYDDTLLFHAVGQPQPEAIELAKIVRLSWG